MLLKQNWLKNKRNKSILQVIVMLWFSEPHEVFISSQINFHEHMFWRNQGLSFHFCSSKMSTESEQNRHQKPVSSSNLNFLALHRHPATSLLNIKWFRCEIATASSLVSDSSSVPLSLMDDLCFFTLETVSYTSYFYTCPAAFRCGWNDGTIINLSTCDVHS